jgi:hypothetical protein
VNIYTQGSGVPVNPRTNCPHLDSGLTPFESTFPSVVNDASLVITSGMKLLLRDCSIANAATIIINRITIQSGGVLVFDDTDIVLNVKEIMIQFGGTLSIGSETCRLYSNIKITYHGSRTTSSHTLFDAVTPTKGLESKGLVDVHGKQFHPTWTRLSRNIVAGSSILFLQDPVNWEVGQQILITPSIFYDCPAVFQNTYCDNVAHQNELRTIVALSISPITGEQAIQLSSPLVYAHYAGVEYQSEVVLLSRRILFVGSDSGDSFGGHTIVMGSGVGRFSGVQANKMGQLNVLARYPFHFHHLGNGGSQSFFQDCSVTNSFFRCFTIHATNSSRTSRNTAFNVSGMCYYLEDGVEELNLLEYNFAGHIHPIGTPANGGYGQSASWTRQDLVNLVNPADTSASGFYILSAYNDLIGNAASGGWSGFAFPNTPFPIFNGNGIDWGFNNPYRRPTKRFLGNTAHSTGFYWRGHGAGIYCGAWLQNCSYISDLNDPTPSNCPKVSSYYWETPIFQPEASPGPLLYYNSGRYNRVTVNSDGSDAFMEFVDTKVWLTLKGVAHWGNTIKLTRLEVYDMYTGAMLFGQAGITDALFGGHTGNTNPNANPAWRLDQKEGFQYYDTGVQTILSRITFRNYYAGDTPLRYMDHSDQFIAQGINSAIAIKFENTANAISNFGLQKCGMPDCAGKNPVSPVGKPTMSSMVDAAYDFDGTASGKVGTPSIIGSNRAWWNIGNDCDQTTDVPKLWRCDFSSNRQIAYLEVNIVGLSGIANNAPLWSNCDSSIVVRSQDCNGQNANYTIGYVNQWGKSTAYGITVAPASGGIAGPANTGWYFRVKTQGNVVQNIDGAPNYFELGANMQIPRKNFILFTMAYPAAATFSVKLKYPWGSWPQTTTHAWPNDVPRISAAAIKASQETLVNPSSMTCNGNWPNPYDANCTYTGAVGPAWAFDGTYLYIRVVQAACYMANSYQDCANNKFDFAGATVWNGFNDFVWMVTVTSCPGCIVQKTWRGVDYYQVNDVIPPTAFSNVYGTLTPVTPANIKYTTKNTCPAATIACVTPPTIANSLSVCSGSTASGANCAYTCQNGYNAGNSQTCSNGVWASVGSCNLATGGGNCISTYSGTAAYATGLCANTVSGT